MDYEEKEEKSLEQQLADKENEAAELQRQIKERDLQKLGSESDNIIDSINGYDDILTNLGANESKDLLYVDLFDEGDLNFLRTIIKKMRICKVYNDNILPKRNEERHYTWYTISSGFKVHSTRMELLSANPGSSFRLSLRNEKCHKDYMKKFMHIDEAIIDIQD